jgi:hypothetical protein
MTPRDANEVYLQCLYHHAARDPRDAACLWRLKKPEVDLILQLDAAGLRRLGRLPVPLMRPSRHFDILIGRELPIEATTWMLLADRHGYR